MNETLAAVALSELQESPKNTRKDFNKAALEELTASRKSVV